MIPELDASPVALTSEAVTHAGLEKSVALREHTSWLKKGTRTRERRKLAAHPRASQSSFVFSQPVKVMRVPRVERFPSTVMPSRLDCLQLTRSTFHAFNFQHESHNAHQQHGEMQGSSSCAPPMMCNSPCSIRLPDQTGLRQGEIFQAVSPSACMPLGAYDEKSAV